MAGLLAQWDYNTPQAGTQDGNPSLFHIDIPQPAAWLAHLLPPFMFSASLQNVFVPFAKAVIP